MANNRRIFTVSNAMAAMKYLGQGVNYMEAQATRGFASLSKLSDEALESVAGLADTFADLEGAVKLSIEAFSGLGILQPIISNIGQTEQQLTQLKTSLQSTTLGVQEYQKAMEFAAVTPFAVGQVIRSATLLRTFQFDPFATPKEGGRQLIEVLGDMAGAMGRDVALAAHALNRAMVAEWEIMQNNFQISARMIPKLKGLKSGTKEYGDAIIEFLHKQERFRGGMKLTAQSMTGLISNIEDAFDILKTFIGGTSDAEFLLRGLTFYDRLRDNLRMLYDTASNVSPAKQIFETADGIKTLTEELAKLEKEKPSKTLSQVQIDERKFFNKEALDKAIKEQSEMYLKFSRMYKDRTYMYSPSVTDDEWSKLTISEREKVAGEDTIKSIKDARDAFIAQGGKLTRMSDMFDFYAKRINSGETEINPNLFLDQIEKLQTWGRIIGQFLGAAYDIIATPLVKLVDKSANTILDAGSNFLDNMMGGAFSIANIQKSTMKKNEEDIKQGVQTVIKGTKQYQEMAKQYLGLKANQTEEEFKKLGGEIETILKNSETSIVKRFQIFAIVVRFMANFVKLALAELIDNSPFFKTLDELFTNVKDIFPKLLGVIGNAFEKFIKDYGGMFDIITGEFSKGTDSLKEFGKTLDKELKDGKGEVTDTLAKGIRTVAGYLLVMAGNFIAANTSAAIFGLTVSNIVLSIENLVDAFKKLVSFGSKSDEIEARMKFRDAQKIINKQMAQTLEKSQLSSYGLQFMDMGLGLIEGKDIKEIKYNAAKRSKQRGGELPGYIDEEEFKRQQEIEQRKSSKPGPGASPGLGPGSPGAFFTPGQGPNIFNPLNNIMPNSYLPFLPTLQTEKKSAATTVETDKRQANIINIEINGNITGGHLNELKTYLSGYATGAA